MKAAKNAKWGLFSHDFNFSKHNIYDSVDPSLYGVLFK